MLFVKLSDGSLRYYTDRFLFVPDESSNELCCGDVVVFATNRFGQAVVTFEAPYYHSSFGGLDYLGAAGDGPTFRTVCPD